MNEAIELVEIAMNIAYQHLSDGRYMPSEKELELFEKFSEMLYKEHATASYIHRCMGQRMRGEKEGAARWNDKESFDWHLPK